MNGGNARRIITVAFISWFFLQNGINLSLLSPFLPGEADDKGASKTIVGLIFGIFDFVMIFSSFLIPKYMSTFNFKTYLCFGVVLHTVCTFLIGITTYLNEWLFVAGCLILRVIAAVGTTYLMCTGPPMLFALYPKYKGRMTSLFQVSISIGYSVGPALGSLLFYLGGFALPFLSIGVVGIVVLCFAFVIMLPHERAKSPGEIKSLIKPHSETSTSPDEATNVESVESSGDEKSKLIEAKGRDVYPSTGSTKSPGPPGPPGGPPKPFTPYRLLTDIRLDIASVPYILCNILFGLTGVYLAPYLDNIFGLDEKYAGLLFSTMALSSTVAAPFIGVLCDYNYAWYLFNLGPLFGAVGLVPFLVFIYVPSLQHISILILAFFLVGVTFNIILISGFLVLGDVIEFYYPNNDTTQTQTMVSAWSHLTSIFGRFIGRVFLGGLVFDYAGYDIVVIVQIGLLVAATIIALAFNFYFNRVRANHQKKQHLDN